MGWHGYETRHHKETRPPICEVVLDFFEMQPGGAAVSLRMGEVGGTSPRLARTARGSPRPFSVSSKMPWTRYCLASSAACGVRRRSALLGRRPAVRRARLRRLGCGSIRTGKNCLRRHKCLSVVTSVE